MMVFFDMDGTLANFYGVEGWLDMLIQSDTTPYEIAAPLLNMQVLARRIHTLQNAGVRVGIISWLSKSGTEEYNAAVTEAKKKWLRQHLASVIFDKLYIVPYGTPKEQFAESSLDVLFDDEKRNRDSWTGRAYDVDNILEILKNF